MSRNARALAAQKRLAAMREAEPIEVPKIALSVMAALQVLLAGRPTRPLEIGVADVVELTGESERQAHVGLAFLRDAMIIERARTAGGSGHRAPTRFMLDAEVADVLRRRADEYESLKGNGGAAL